MKNNKKSKTLPRRQLNKRSLKHSLVKKKKLSKKLLTFISKKYIYINI